MRLLGHWAAVPKIMIHPPELYEAAPARATYSDEFESTPIAKVRSTDTIALNVKLSWRNRNRPISWRRSNTLIQNEVLLGRTLGRE